MSHNKSVLIVEDNFLIAMNLKSEFEANDWTVIGPSPNAEEALAYLTSETIHVACLDFSLETGTTEAVADALVERDIPFLFLTGDNLELQESEHGKNRPIILKPIDMDLLVSTATQLLETA